jgi:uncharacterized protein (TIGR04255 family)
LLAGITRDDGLLMADFPHLTHSPIVEALIFFQADASASWELETLRAELAPLWPDHREVQEMHTFKMEMKMEKGKEPKQEVTTPGIEGLMFRSKERPTVYQARRDGFIASWLNPYPDWKEFQSDAVAQWERYASVVGSPALHSVLVKFINRLEFPLGEFTPEGYFTTLPATPPNLRWRLVNFIQQAEYAVPGTNYVVQTMLARAFDNAPETVAFILDIEVKLREPLTATGRALDDVLREMSCLKNEAFFNLLTERARQGYL